ncbi:YwqI/YxiC family protein [Cytobacillus firmus]|uniref:YwqI/YxiC family protein n=1 Tax=Cytobacillus firmus TaxID=1399 RepID=UPI002186DA54|nr:YwqI/YxiC family protein [Cytobacillus firmus]URM32860.1 YwqI/YxiC family protein [Cytobacillus firmus]
MNTEIKLRISDIEQALSKLQSSANGLQSSLPSTIGENNVLDFINKLNALNRQLQQVTEAYKSVLLQNEDTTRQSVQFLDESDRLLSRGYMRCRKNNPLSKQPFFIEYKRLHPSFGQLMGSLFLSPQCWQNTRISHSPPLFKISINESL